MNGIGQDSECISAATCVGRSIRAALLDRSASTGTPRTTRRHMHPKPFVQRWTDRALAICAALLAAHSAAATAAERDYPDRPVRLIIAMPPGGGLDTTARYLARELTDRLKQPFI